MTIRVIMNQNLLVVTRAMSLTKATKLLIDNHITGLPVVDEQRNILGVVTEMDLIQVIANPHLHWRTVGDIMTPNPVTVNVEEPLHAVFDCLMTHSFRRVLVEDQGKLVGLISRTDLLPVILDQLSAMEL
jgi:predicted transcriptional regulator